MFRFSEKSITSHKIEKVSIVTATVPLAGVPET